MNSRTILCIVVIFFINNIITVTGLYSTLKDGDPCVWQNVTGKCVNKNRCEILRVDINLNNPPPVCGNGNDSAIICCTGCHIRTVINGLKYEQQIQREEGRTGVKHFDKCVQYYNDFYYKCNNKPAFYYEKQLIRGSSWRLCYADTSRVTPFIVGGDPARRSEFPHMALLGYGEDLESAQWLCGGTLISERYILTAAHCGSSPELGRVKFVGLGMLKRSDPVSLWDRYDVKRFIPHPEYRSPSKYHDIALIEANTTIHFTLSVLPACITNENIEDLPWVFDNNIKTYATGWGGLGHRQDLANILQKVQLQQFSELECAVQYPPNRNLRSGYNHTTQMCYGDRTKPKDTCGGDSGGPLQLRAHDISCTEVVIGVTSYGGACGFVGAAGIYTRVRDYVPWIENIAWP